MKPRPSQAVEAVMESRRDDRLLQDAVERSESQDPKEEINHSSPNFCQWSGSNLNGFNGFECKHPIFNDIKRYRRIDVYQLLCK